MTPDTIQRVLRDHDFVYECPPLEWVDGIPLANGRIGALIWGDGHPLRFTLDSYGVWETRTLWPGDDPRFNYANLRRLKEKGRMTELREIALRRRNLRFVENPPPHPTRLALGRLEIRWPGAAGKFAARLDLFRAAARGTLAFPEGKAAFSSFVCSTRDVLVVEIRCEKGVPLPEAHIVPAVLDGFSRRHLRSWKYPEPEIHAEPGRRILFRRYSVGKEYTIAAEEARAAGALTIFLTIIPGADGEHTREQALRQLSAARKLGVTALRNAHDKDWAGFWTKSAIRLPDSRLENLYYAEMYKHYCSSRPGPGRLPITLQGLWTTDGAWPPWRGSYTTDMNVQESYWPIYTSNHLESGEPLYEMYWRNLPLHRKLGEYWYGKPIAVITGEHGPGGEPFPGYFTDEHSPGAGAWIAHHFWLHWLYSQDRKFLRERAYPFLKEMVQAYLHIVEKRADGKCHIPFTDSPEFFCGRPEAMGNDNNYDLALLRFLLEALMESQKYLPGRDQDCRKWEKVLKNLISYPMVPTALYEYDHMAGAGEPASDVSKHLCLALRAGEALPHSHRHHSHLIGIYPLGVINPERSEAERKLVEKSLEDLVFKGTGEWMGWSFPWASMIAGRTGKATIAHHFLQMYLQGFVGPNTFHFNNSDERQPNGICARQGRAMTLEAGFAAAAAILEMLLQSQHGLIRVFPACPPAWGDIRFFNLRAEGAFLVAAQRRNHETMFVEITSEAEGVCRVRNPFKGACALTDLSAKKTRVFRGKVLQFAAKRGGQYRLAASEAKLRGPAPAWPAGRRSARERNWFGVKL